MIKIKNFVKFYIIFIFFISSCVVMKQNPAIIEKGNKNNNFIKDNSNIDFSDNLEDNYSSYPITQNNTDIDNINNYDIKKDDYYSDNQEKNINDSNDNKNLNTHTVVYGDTVYNISKKYNISKNDLIRWNKIVDNSISIGQLLFIKGPKLSNYDKSMSKDIPKSVNNSGYNIFNENSKTKNYDGILWVRPTDGNIISYYGSKNKGIDFSGSVNSPIFAVADGKVVYSGSGLKGYGNLIIIQHTPVYLTAYGNNQSLLFKRGDKVLRGQKIATMGNSDSLNVKLHFELRKNGKPVNPINIIPF